MVEQARGAAGAANVVADNLQNYTVWCVSPNAFADPVEATGVNIRSTGRIIDESQKNFEVLVQSIGLRAMPVRMDKPLAVDDVSQHGATLLKGEGFVWRFAVESRNVFLANESEIGLLVEEINRIVLPNGTILSTKGADVNIEFRYEGRW